MAKVVFIINSIQQQRCLKRVSEFIERGYEVEVYGFNRSSQIPTLPQNFEIEIVGSFANSMSYYKRMVLMYKALNPIFKKHKKEDVIYYFFLLDVAMIGKLLCGGKPYIYEESDLMQTYLRSKLLCGVLNRIDKRIIRRSLLTTMTSEGFVQYHFEGSKPSNVIIVPNRLNKKIEQYTPQAHTTDMKHLRFGFVGGARFESVVSMAETILQQFPQHEFHFYGNPVEHLEKFEKMREKYTNVFFHGKFSNPQDLPKIYSNIDLVVTTYDVKYANVRYAEPNKLYESIYFRVPIIVTEGTYLSEKVRGWGVGFSIDPLDKREITGFVENLREEDIERCKDNCRKIPKTELIDDNPKLFDYIEQHKKKK